LPSAGTFARRALNMARRLDDDLQLLQASLDIGYVYMLSSVEFEGSYKRAYEAAYRLDSLGWRNVVIAQAAGAHYIAGDMSGCVRWGDRMRDRAMGAMPGVQDSQLWIDDYITLMCQYTLALNETQPESPRIEETRQLALAAIETLEGDARAGWSDVEENLRGEPLNPGEEK
jgi:hypothetical protein